MIGVFGARTGEEEAAAAATAIRAGWMGMGPQVDAFERALGEHLGAGLVMVDSGTNALHVALAALDLPPGSDVVVPSLTWVGCANAVVLAGHRPVFADVDPVTHNVSPEAVEAVRTPATAAVMVVHYAGKPADVAGLAALGLPLLEDAAHAIDSTVHGRACGTLGAAGIYSFDAVKNLATPDGGGVTAPDPERLDRARRLRYCGIGASGFTRAQADDAARWWEVPPGDAFPRALPNDVSAAVGLVQLERLADNQRRRHAVWRAYQEAFADLAWLQRPADPEPHERHSWFTYLVRIAGGRRDRLALRLREAGIYTTLRYHPLHLGTRHGPPGQRLPVCEAIAEDGLNLPLHPALDSADVDRVIAAVRAAA